eukprot:GHVN01022694.1.p1 GENE.GHVN01022694.1~~GHVN01022694.1.p1  ORF type:complete len:282 (+),score=70.31 GHVN01022694.1:44-847(+)
MPVPQHISGPQWNEGNLYDKILEMSLFEGGDIPNEHRGHCYPSSPIRQSPHSLGSNSDHSHRSRSPHTVTYVTRRKANPPAPPRSASPHSPAAANRRAANKSRSPHHYTHPPPPISELPLSEGSSRPHPPRQHERPTSHPTHLTNPTHPASLLTKQQGASRAATFRERVKVVASQQRHQAAVARSPTGQSLRVKGAKPSRSDVPQASTSAQPPQSVVRGGSTPQTRHTQGDVCHAPPHTPYANNHPPALGDKADLIERLNRQGGGRN